MPYTARKRFRSSSYAKRSRSVDMPTYGPRRTAPLPVMHWALARWDQATGSVNNSNTQRNGTGSLFPTIAGSIYPLTNVAKGDGFNERDHYSILPQKLELRASITLDAGAAHMPVRITIFRDTEGRTTGGPLSGIPVIGDVFDSNTIFAGGLPVNLDSDIFSFPRQDNKNRFEILYQEVIQMGRGAENPAPAYENIYQTEKLWMKDLMLSGEIRYHTSSISGGPENVASGGLYICCQSQGDAGASTSCFFAFTSRFTFLTS